MIETLKYLMNGGKLPNWGKLLLGISALLIVGALQRLAVDDLADNQTRNTNRQIREMRAWMILLQSDNEETRDYIATVARRDSIRAKKIERLVLEVRGEVDDLNETGTNGSNARIDQMYRLLQGIDRRGRNRP